jgi:hypothetical protein
LSDFVWPVVGVLLALILAWCYKHPFLRLLLGKVGWKGLLRLYFKLWCGWTWSAIFNWWIKLVVNSPWLVYRVISYPAHFFNRLLFSELHNLFKVLRFLTVLSPFLFVLLVYLIKINMLANVLIIALIFFLLSYLIIFIILVFIIFFKAIHNLWVDEKEIFLLVYYTFILNFILILYLFFCLFSSFYNFLSCY